VAANDLLDEILNLEIQVWEALVRGDAQADTDLLAVDFVGVYPTGFGGRTDHADQLTDGPSVATYAIAEVRIIDLAGAGALLLYRAEYERPGPDARQETMYVSSLWVRRADRWLNIFSQDTPAGNVDPP